MERLIKVKLFLSYDLKTKILLIEACFYLGWAYILLKRPFKKVSPKLGVENWETPIDNEKFSLLVIKHVSSAICTMSRNTLWESKCFVQAIAGMKMLERRGIESTLYLGTARDDNGTMIAHAWLRSGSFYISGKEVMDRFTVVSKFAKQVESTNRGRLNG